ncbi:hypothetical protein [Celeribacter litoreus]|uniref:hypothetical protein n=1 Tax=Celeribacter litoreus TaxID=2876714 RepID=UPI001CCA4AB0|nr:hypothetical protein [Celeribacter litoreus]MCA0043271.1 hypothetical protein [Celeribacter litoreus]
MRYAWILGGCFALAGCAAPMTQDGYLKEVPESVVSLADPSQDLTVVQLNPTDNCFWYQHRGPVETTMLPLRTTSGRPICAQSPGVLETAM